MDGPYVKVMKWQPGIVNDALNYCSYIHILRKGTSINNVQFLGVTLESFPYIAFYHTHAPPAMYFYDLSKDKSNPLFIFAVRNI